MSNTTFSYGRRTVFINALGNSRFQATVQDNRAGSLAVMVTIQDDQIVHWGHRARRTISARLERSILANVRAMLEEF